jgi:ubiquinone/menaquinone biosynthesis C-methylase UbiE
MSPTAPKLWPVQTSWVCCRMPDRLFDDLYLASLYDLLSPWDERGDFTFYLPLVMSSDSVLDVGCGTGALLHRARDEGHQGRLCGIDPANGMLAQARKISDIEWVLGDLASTSWNSEFDLIVMTGHAFQVLVEDDDLRTALAAVRSALTPDGCFAFETRNPSVRGWESWSTEYSTQITDSTGSVIRVECKVDTPVEKDIVHSVTHSRACLANHRSAIAR